MTPNHKYLINHLNIYSI
jgi:hypothetical protein